jgi:hypothetical protein
VKGKEGLGGGREEEERKKLKKNEFWACLKQQHARVQHTRGGGRVGGPFGRFFF